LKHAAGCRACKGRGPIQKGRCGRVRQTGVGIDVARPRVGVVRRIIIAGANAIIQANNDAPNMEAGPSKAVQPGVRHPEMMVLLRAGSRAAAASQTRVHSRHSAGRIAHSYRVHRRLGRRPVFRGVTDGEKREAEAPALLGPAFAGTGTKRCKAVAARGAPCASRPSFLHWSLTLEKNDAFGGFFLGVAPG